MPEKDIREHCIELYAVNDVHGRFFNTPHYSTGERVSLANVSRYLNLRRDELGQENVLVLDCGDNLQGDYASCWSNERVRELGEEHVYPEIAEYLGYDAVVFGNHDIEAGPQVYGKVAGQLRQYGIPLLGANLSGTTVQKCNITPYTIICKGGVRIAVIGLANPCTSKWIPKDLMEGIGFAPLLPAAEMAVNEIRGAELADMVVLLVHSGLGYEGENQALSIADSIKGIDVVFAGHDHNPGCCRVGDTLLLSASSHASQIQKVRVMVEKNGEKVAVKKIEGTVVNMGTVEEDEGYLEHFKGEREAVERYMGEPIGSIMERLDPRKALCGMESYVGLLHSVQLEVSGAEISFASPYMYDSIIEAGAISRRELFMMYSAENTLFKVRMTGRQIKDYLEFSYGKWISDFEKGEGHLLQLCSTDLDGKTWWWPRNFTYNFDSAAGLVYRVDITRRYGERVMIEALWNGEPFDPERDYTVALSSYRVSGGGELFDCGAGIDPQKELEGITLARYTYIRDLVGDFIKKGKWVDAARCGYWEFVPKEKAAQALASDTRLLFGREYTL